MRVVRGTLKFFFLFFSSLGVSLSAIVDLADSRLRMRLRPTESTVLFRGGSAGVAGHSVICDSEPDYTTYAGQTIHYGDPLTQQNTDLNIVVQLVERLLEHVNLRAALNLEWRMRQLEHRPVFAQEGTFSSGKYAPQQRFHGLKEAKESGKTRRAWVREHEDRIAEHKRD